MTTYVGFSDDKQEAFDKIQEQGTLTVDRDSPNLQTERMYTLIVECEVASSFKVLISQKKTVIELADGVPQTLVYEDNKDKSKFVIMSIPPGD